jgi:hypothetical protein
VRGTASGAAASCSIRHPSTRPSAAVSSMQAMLWPGDAACGQQAPTLGGGTRAHHGIRDTVG